jgi:hypothetical protein
VLQLSGIKNKKLRYVFSRIKRACLFTFLFSAVPFAETIDYHHSVSLELFGKYLYFGGISYEYHFTKHWSAGTGFGIMEPYTTSFYNDINDIKEVKGLNHALPVYISGMLGEKHVFIGSAGCTFLSDLQFIKSGRKPTRLNYIFDQCVPFISAGYEYSFRRFFLRIPGYLGYIGDNEFFPAFFPSLGVLCGVKF